MTRRPDDSQPEPPGGRAAERLREFIDQRFPGGPPPRQGEEAPNRPDAEREAANSEEHSTQ